MILIQLDAVFAMADVRVIVIKINKIIIKLKTQNKKRRNIKKKKKKGKKSYIEMIFEALSNEAMSERDKRNGLTQTNVINYIKEKINFTDITKVLIISSIEDGLKRGVLQKGINGKRYKITHLGGIEYKKKCKKKYNINNMSEEQKNKQQIKNEIKSKYNEKYYDSKYCKFDDELDANIVYKMNVETLKKNLKYRGLKVGGNKYELGNRLICYLNDKKCVNSKTFKELKNNLKQTSINEFESKYVQRKKRIEQEKKIEKEAKDDERCTRNLYNVLIGINDKFMDIKIANDIWKFIALYADGIASKCNGCSKKKIEQEAEEDERCTQNLYNVLIGINDKFMDIKIANDIWKFIALYADGIASKCNGCSKEIHISVPFKMNKLIDEKYYIFDRYYFYNPYHGRIYKLNGRVYCSMCYDVVICDNCEGLLHPNDSLYCTDYDGCIICKGKYCDKCESEYKMSRKYTGWCFRAGAACCKRCLEDLSDQDKEW
eukprot:247630_1